MATTSGMSNTKRNRGRGARCRGLCDAGTAREGAPHGIRIRTRGSTFLQRRTMELILQGCLVQRTRRAAVAAP